MFREGPVKTVQTTVLSIAYHEMGPSDGDPVILLHGFPYDPHCFDAVATNLASKGVALHYAIFTRLWWECI